MIATKIPTEESEQMALITWLSDLARHIADLLFFAIPNGGIRPMVTAKKLKAAGVKAGVPDLFIATARGGYHGLFIEMKRTTGGQVSSFQKQWLADLAANGYQVYVCKGANAAAEVILKYLGYS
jgi:hypothetical protein